MVYIFMGQSCTGKSTAAEKLKEMINCEIYSGKDYLRMAKNENEAWNIFGEKLNNAALNKESLQESIVYIVTEKDILPKLDKIQNAVKVKFDSDFEVIKSRFAKRMRGNLPKPVEKMLEKQYSDWKNVKGDFTVNTSEEGNIEEVINNILSI